MDVTIVYFSQTGNTYKVAKVIVDAFQEGNHRSRMIALNDASADTLSRVNLLGIGTPCFSNRAPQPVMRFINSLRPMKNQKVFIFATCGGAPGRVLFDMGNALQKKGANIFAGHLFRGEVHHPAPILYGRFPGRPNNEDLNLARNFARVIYAQISKGLPVNDSKRYVQALRRRWGFYEFLGWVISDSTLRLFLPKPKLDPINCDHCGLCAQGCPSQNISLAPHPVLGSACIRCYHCYNGCPRRALIINWRFCNPILWLLYNQTFIRRFGDLAPGEQINDKCVSNTQGV